MRLSIIVPFHRNLDYLRRCLEPLRGLAVEHELIVVADGAKDDCRKVAADCGARVLEIPGPSGPAVARNRGAAVATGDVLLFIDSDVVASEQAIRLMAAVFMSRPDVSAAFGAYDESPAAANFISQYKNLAHSYIHQSSSAVAESFWAGLGAIRASVFARVGGFDERYRRPSIEDIDLGYRLSAAGYRILLLHEARGCHLKRWTLTSLLRTDVRDRGIPWTQLILRSRRVQNDLNLKSAYRISVMLAYALLALVPLTFVQPMSLLAAAVASGFLYHFNRRFYAFFIGRRGIRFALCVIPLHYLYHLYNGVSFLIGTAIYLSNRWLSVELPGALPLVPWNLTALRVPANATIVAEPARGYVAALVK